MKKNIFKVTLLFWVILALNTRAQQRSLHELDSIANSIFVQTSSRSVVSPLKIKSRSSEILPSTSQHESEAFYIYTPTSDEEKKFVIVSSDQRMPAILAYSDSNGFDPENIPNGLKWLLTIYKTKAAQIDQECILTNIVPQEQQHEQPIVEPLLENLAWGQSTPYNLQCPLKGDKHTLTGCIATALAQIMAYYRYPIQYDWDNMLDTYKSEYTEEQANAVASLMSDIGKACDMMYGTSVSTTGNSNAVKALTNSNFDYDDDVRFVKQEYHLENQWINILNNELREGRPILYAGLDKYNSKNGHAFVMDGTNGQGYYHINWGWEGSGNGYFHIFSLTPNEKSDYSMDSQIIIGIHPNDSIPDDNPTNISCSDIISQNGRGIFAREEAIKLAIYDFTNRHHKDLKGETQLILTDAKNDSLICLLGKPRSIKNLPSSSMYSSATKIEGTLPSDLPDGTYHIYAGVRYTGYETWGTVQCRIKDNTNESNYFELNLKKGYYTLGTGKQPDEEHIYKLVCEELGIDKTLNQTLARGKKIHPVKKNEYIIKNFGETPFNGLCQLLLTNKEGTEIYPIGEAIKTSIVASKVDYSYINKEITIDACLPDNLANGHYHLYLGAKAEGSDKWSFVENSDEQKKSYVTLSVRDSHIRLGEDFEEPDFSFKTILTDSMAKLEIEQEYKATLKITNTSAKTNTFSYYACLDTLEIYRSQEQIIKPGETVIDSIRFFLPQETTMKDYNLSFYYTADKSPLFGEGHNIHHLISVYEFTGITLANNDLNQNWATIKIEEDRLHFTPHINLKQWKMATASGKIIAQGEKTERTCTIHTGALPVGIYLLSVIDNNGQIHTAKVVILE